MERYALAKELIAIARQLVTADARFVRDLKQGDLIEFKQMGEKKKEKRVVDFVIPTDFVNEDDGTIEKYITIHFNNGYHMIVEEDATVEFLESASVIKRLLHKILADVR